MPQMNRQYILVQKYPFGYELVNRETGKSRFVKELPSDMKRVDPAISLSPVERNNLIRGVRQFRSTLGC